jgi:hypothetical protein
MSFVNSLMDGFGDPSSFSIASSSFAIIFLTRVRVSVPRVGDDFGAPLLRFPAVFVATSLTSRRSCRARLASTTQNYQPLSRPSISRSLEDIENKTNKNYQVL